MPGPAAFTAAFGLGIIYSVILTGRWVFGSSLTGRRTAIFIAAYALIYLCGLGIVSMFTAIGLQPWVNGTSVLITAPLSFLAGRAIFAPSPMRQETPL